MGVISGLAAWLFGVFNVFLTTIGNHFLATKIIMGVLFITVLPVVLNNLIYDLIETSLNFISSSVTSEGLEPFSMQLTGLGAWLAEVLKITDAFSVIMSAVAFKFTLRLIPFVRV